jgi:P-type E1-E2 ATPase
MVITFGVVLTFTSVREGFEDYMRYKKDKKANNKRYAIFDSKNLKNFEIKPSRKMHVGDTVKIFCDQEIPADICLIKSSNRNGICFLDTVNLDGESNLKDKKCNNYLQSLNEIDNCNLNGYLKCDKPNEQLDYWEGFMTINNYNYNFLENSDNPNQTRLTLE